MAIIKLVVAWIMSLATILTPYVQFAVNGGIDKFFEKWSPEDAYTEEYAVELVKAPEKAFVVLNFSHSQLNPQNVFSENGEKTYAMIKKCVEEVKPDLITLTGDNSTSVVGYIELAKLLDSFGIPWAPVMGNHDGENGNVTKEGRIAYILAHSENCLFKFGPADMGYGNWKLKVSDLICIYDSIRFVIAPQYVNDKGFCVFFARQQKKIEKEAASSRRAIMSDILIGDNEISTMVYPEGKEDKAHLVHYRRK